MSYYGPPQVPPPGYGTGSPGQPGPPGPPPGGPSYGAGPPPQGPSGGDDDNGNSAAKGWGIGCGIVAVLAVLAVLVGSCAAVFADPDSPRGWIAEHYTLDTQASAESFDDDSDVYTSTSSPSAVTAAIVDQVRPTDRVDRSLDNPVDSTTGPLGDSSEGTARSGTGHFLLYEDDVVAVLPDRDGSGTQIYVDETEDGIRRWHAYVQHHHWGTRYSPDGK